MSENPGTHVERQGRKIVASPTHSSLPDCGHDFCAHYDGDEEAGGYGYGATPEAAIADFLENCQEDRHVGGIAGGGNLATPRISPGFKENLEQLRALGGGRTSEPGIMAKLFAGKPEGGAS